MLARCIAGQFRPKGSFQVGLSRPETPAAATTADVRVGASLRTAESLLVSAGDCLAPHGVTKSEFETSVASKDLAMTL